MSARSLLGHAGTCASAACLIHCMLMPILLTVLPIAGLGMLMHGWMEWALLGGGILCTLASLCWGFPTHRRWRVMAMFVAAVLWIGLSLQHDRHHLVYMTVGGLCLAASNFMNLYFCRTCKACCETSHAH